MLLTSWVTLASVGTLLILERLAKPINGHPLAPWQRWLLPWPIFLFLAWNLDAVLSHGAWLEAHPGHFVVRYSENFAWETWRFALAGMVSLFLIPCVLGSTFWRGMHIGVLWAFFHLLWGFFVLFLLALSTGMPLRQ